MSQIARQRADLAQASKAPTVDSWRKQIAAENPELWQAVLFVLGLFQTAGILTQNKSRFDIDDPNQIAFYVKDCIDLGVTIEVLMDHHNEVRRSLKWWPVSGEFAKEFVEFRQATWIVHPDFVGYLVRDGIISICDTRQCQEAVNNDEANRLCNEYWKARRLEQEALAGSNVKALPATEGKAPSIKGVVKALTSGVETYSQSEIEVAERKRLLRVQARELGRTG